MLETDDSKLGVLYCYEKLAHVEGYCISLI